MADNIVDVAQEGGALNKKQAEEARDKVKENYNVSKRKAAARKSLDGSPRDASRFDKESQELFDSLDKIGKDIENKTIKLSGDITAKIRWNIFWS